MMNTTTYNPSGMHQEHNVVVTHAHQHAHSHPAAGLAPVGYLHQSGPLQLHATQPLSAEQLTAAITTSADGSAHSTTNAAALFDPRRLQLAAPLDKNYYTTASAASVSAPTSGAHFYTTTAATTTAGTPSAAVEHQHQHPHGNTILITNNFAAQQQFTPAPQAHTQQNGAAATLQQQSNGAIAGIPPVTAATGSYNGNGSNIRIITTLPNSLQPNVMSQQHIYNIVKDEDQHQASDMLHQLHPSPYYQPQQAATHFTQHLPTSLQHFTQQHFAATQPATQPQAHATATHLQLPNAPQQFFMPLTDTSGATLTAAAAANTAATTKLLSTLPTLAGNVSVTSSAAVNADATTSTTTMTPAAANSTVVLDRINICINNHYSDSMASSSTTMDSTTTNTHALANVSHAQQPSPIIPAIHHKVVVDTSCTSGSGSSGSGSGAGSISSALHIDPYASNDSTLVIDEPDSTTTTPHTPPATPENSSPPPVSSALTAATLEASPSKDAQPTTTTTVTTVQSNAPRNAFVAISQSIEVIEDDEDNGNVDGKVLENTEAVLPKEVLKIQTDNPKIEIVNVEQLIVGDTKIADGPVIQQCTVLNSVESVQEAITIDPQPVTQSLRTNTPPPPCTSVVLLTPPTPTTPPMHPQFELSYTIEEDVFVRKEDSRLYLGTVIEINENRQQYLVRFNDKSELWCSADQMRKPGGSVSDGGSENSTEPGRMCVACKRTQRNDVVEICERCGRGYHRSCTSETSPDSGIWWCKRCCKPMRMMPNSKSTSVCRQLPYHAEALKWDEKHRVNEEQFYCYCGKTGQFDNNMLQCCKCRNWFHTRCMQNFKAILLRGDGFFVFCCTICNDGKEFLRRLQITPVDLLHLALYNLSVMKKHHKYHHLIKDIFPFILEKRHKLPVPKEWTQMSKTDLMENITNVLKENSNRFVCGREGKRDLSYYALRNICPPVLSTINVHSDDVLTDELLINYGLNIFTQHSSSFSCTSYKNTSEFSKTEQKQNTDVYEFRIEDDEKFTSEDEIPIKHIIEKGKKCKDTTYIDKCSAKSKGKKYSTTTMYEKIVLDDENANDANCGLIVASPKQSQPKIQHELKQSPKKDHAGAQQKSSSVDNKEKPQLYYDQDIAIETKATGAVEAINVSTEKSSRKRKAFTLSNSYKEIAAEAAAKRYDSSRICDSSSDENSSSSRGTSLDVIIPPPKNFLGLNNPFRMVTPKKCTSAVSVGGGQNLLYFGRSGTMIKNSIFNTTALDFSSKLAALKSAGIFPNLSTSNLAKAAGQPRTVRTIKRRLSAKDITIGPNQEVRRRRTRRLSSNIEVISTTTINPIPSNFFPIHAKDLLTNATAMPAAHTTIVSTAFKTQPQQLQAPPAHPTAALSSASSSPLGSVTSSVDSGQLEVLNKPTHGRRLRQRPQKISPSNSRRSSISSASTTSTNSSSNVTLATLQQQVHNNASNTVAVAVASATTNAADPTMQDLKQTVKEYFGAVNRIESGDQFCIRAKRQLANGQMQYLIEWGDAATATTAVTTSGM